MEADLNDIHANGVDELFPLVFAFNYRPSTYLHESWATQILPATLLPTLATSRRIHARLSAYVLEHFNLVDRVVLDFRSRLRRVALVDSATLNKTLRVVGVATNWPWIQKVIDRQTLASLNRAIGAEAYEFALQRAPFLSFPDERVFEEDPDPADYAAFFDRCGAVVASASFADEPPELVERLRLKLPSGLTFGADRVTLRTLPTSPERMLWKVITEIEPRWAKLFA